MIPAADTWTMLDTFQEFSFILFVYGANIWVVFIDGDIYNMVLNSLAMEFLMNLDNEFEEMVYVEDQNWMDKYVDPILAPIFEAQGFINPFKFQQH